MSVDAVARCSAPLLSTPTASSRLETRTSFAPAAWRPEEGDSFTYLTRVCVCVCVCRRNDGAGGGVFVCCAVVACGFLGTWQQRRGGCTTHETPKTGHHHRTHSAPGECVCARRVRCTSVPTRDATSVGVTPTFVNTSTHTRATSKHTRDKIPKGKLTCKLSLAGLSRSRILSL